MNSTIYPAIQTNPVEQNNETFRMYKIIIEIYVVGFLCIFGILGNGISILVLGKDRTMRRTTAFILQMVALADTLYLMTCLFFQTFKTIIDFTDWMPSLKFYWPYMEQYVWAGASIAQTCTVWLVLILTADRYIAICKPLHAPQYSTMRRMTRIVIIIWVAAVVYNIPRFFERTIVMRFDNETNTSYPKVIKSEMRENSYYFIVYKSACYFILRVLIPLSLLAFFNTRLIQAIKDSHKLARIHTEKICSDGARPRTEKNRHTLTLVVVVIVFVICTTPDLLLSIWISLTYFTALKIHLPTARYYNTISNLLLAINSCVNFVIYCFLGQKFRSILVHMLCKKAASQGHELSMYSQINTKSMVHVRSADITEEMTILMTSQSH